MVRRAIGGSNVYVRGKLSGGGVRNDTQVPTQEGHSLLGGAVGNVALLLFGSDQLEV